MKNRIDYLVLSTLSTKGKIQYHKNKKEMLEKLGCSCKIIGPKNNSGLKKFVPWPLSLFVESLELRRKLNNFLKKNDAKIIEFDNAAALLQKNSVFKKYKTMISFDHPFLCQKSLFLSLAKILEKKRFNQCDIILSRSKLAQDFLKEKFSNVLFLPHSIKTNPNYLSFGKKKYVLFYSSSKNQFNVKGLDVLISFWKKYNSKDLKLKIAGEKKEKITKYFKNKGISVPTNVDFLGKISHKNFLDLIKDSYFIINSSRYEATGLSTLEALSFGKLVFCTPTEGSMEFLNKNKELVSKNFTSESILETIGSLENRNRKIKADLREFSYGQNMKKLKKILRKLKILKIN